jgi:hypothetical protein
MIEYTPKQIRSKRDNRDEKEKKMGLRNEDR